MIALLLKFGLGGLDIARAIGAALKRFFAALDLQGWLGLVAALALAFAWLRAAGEARHWQKESGQFEKLYNGERAALDQTIANYRTAADQARQADVANAARVTAEQRAINERTSDDYETRIADVRARAERLRLQPQAAADPSASRGAPMPGLSPAPAGPHESAGQDRLSPSDALTATEQAIQLDELIKWVKAQAKVDNNPKAVASPPGD